MITPYKNDGEINYDTVVRLVDWYREGNLDGIFSACHSTEIHRLSIDEIVRFNRTVYNRVQEINRDSAKKMKVVSSGHIGGTIVEQAENLKRIYDTGCDALIMITNRFDPDREGDDVWIKNAEKMLTLLPQDIPLGLYECPLPYKRLVTPKILSWCKEVGRFTYMKDTCCDADVIKERTTLLKGSSFGMYNANSQTLLRSLREGAAGYCGIMANFHPKLYSWLCEHYAEESETVERVQALLCSTAFIEAGLPYPLTAKYHMNLEGIHMPVRSRSVFGSDWSHYAEECVDQLRLLTKAAEKELGL